VRYGTVRYRSVDVGRQQPAAISQQQAAIVVSHSRPAVVTAWLRTYVLANSVGASGCALIHASCAAKVLLLTPPMVDRERNKVMVAW
jgi:hypothetical protein